MFHIRHPNLDLLAWEEEPPENLALKTSGFHHRSSTIVGKTDSTLGWHTQGFTCIGPWGKAVVPWESGPDVPAGLGKSPEKMGRVLAYCGNKDIGGGNICMRSPECPHCHT